MRGDADAGYEPDLLIELEAIQDKTKRDKKTRSKQGTMRHVAYVLKDRRMILNGLKFEWKDLNAYKAGDYKAVWKAFAPHFVQMGHISSGPVAVLSRSSTELFEPIRGESTFAEAARRRQIAVEELQATLAMIWPGQTGEEKRLKTIILESLFQTRSWTAVEHKDPLVLESAVNILHRFEAILDPAKAKSEADVIATIETVKDELREASCC